LSAIIFMKPACGIAPPVQVDTSVVNQWYSILYQWYWMVLISLLSSIN